MNSYKEPKTSARGRQIIYSSEFVNKNKELIQTMGIMPTPEEMVYDELSTQGDLVYGVDDEQSGKKVGNGNILRFENGLLIEQKG